MKDNNLIINPDTIYIIPKLQNKPVKIILENDSTSVTTEIYHLTLKEVLRDILNQNWKLRITLTTQQIRSEKGKVRKGYCDEVINFLHKRGVSKEYIENEVTIEREKLVFSINWHVSSDVLSDNKFGIFNIEN
jgi:hypothetical protein